MTEVRLLEGTGTFSSLQPQIGPEIKCNKYPEIFHEYKATGASS